LAPALVDAPPRRWTDLRARAISALLLAPAVLACVWAGGVAFYALAVAATLGMALEWSRLFGHLDRSAPTITVICVTLAAVVLGARDLAFAAMGVTVIGTLVVAVLAGAGRRIPFALGVPYIGLGMAALVWFRGDPDNGLAAVLVLILLVWASDIGAYMTGRWLGGPKLALAISPNKTVSGAVGGLVVAVGVALVASFALRPPDSWIKTAALAAVLGLAAQAGDLFESAIKRKVGAKDSGRLIPGHGGLLDRLDALITAAPVAAALAWAAGRGVVFWQ
jgi:phosphatidate cytidylyltransferase